MNKRVRMIAPASVRPFIRKLVTPFRTVKARVQVAFGLEPLSVVWASDRGVPIARYYLGQFLRQFRGDVKGRCLEFQHDTYSTKVGGSAVVSLDILHIDASNPLATIVADITQPNDIPSDHYDCIICTHVLHVIPALDKAVAEMYRILKPGGVVLVAVPQVSMCDPGYHELWRFTLEGLGTLLTRSFGSGNVLVQAYGNSLTSACEIRGLASEELSRKALDYHDARFAVEVCARAVKPVQSE